jgi:hypothetical protein
MLPTIPNIITFEPGDLIYFNYRENVHLRRGPCFNDTGSIPVKGDTPCLVLQVLDGERALQYPQPECFSKVWYLVLAGGVIGYAWSAWRIVRV